jgi:hypothetical protein
MLLNSVTPYQSSSCPPASTPNTARFTAFDTLFLHDLPVRELAGVLKSFWRLSDFEDFATPQITRAVLSDAAAPIHGSVAIKRRRGE